MVNQTGHIDQIKQLNTGIVYRIIDQHGPISRIALSKQAQLAPASITKITRELMDAHLIKELEFPVLGLRGRPAVGLVIESEGWQFLAIRIEGQKLIISLKEINAVTLAQTEYPFTPLGNSEFMDSLTELISQFFASNQKILERVTAISILIDGILDPHTGVIYQHPSFKIHQLAIAESLTKQTGLPVYLHPPVDALALMDHFSHQEKRKEKNIIYLQLQDVVNVMVLSHGTTLDTNTHRPILFGHTQCEPCNHNFCYCGSDGCLETQTSIPAILHQAESLLINYPDSHLHQKNISIDNICSGAISNDSLCVYLINQVAQRLAKPLGLMVNLLGSELILVNSPLNQDSELFLECLHNHINKHTIPLYSSNLVIEKSIFTVKDSETSLIQRALYDGSLLLQLLQG
ncbi:MULTISPECIES: ROK family protein [Providencia]|uniref:ROK family protein n=1 Tax=Providencia TaxID=586 RepID=UPI000D9559AF|nr:MULTISPECIES: ROK family protein [Providencia]MDH2376548.1 ROK family protein [Providencia rettgeri]QLI97467.1 ROK family protein [Providencia rettgeri]SPZ17291.1 Making large colonies protein [Providencia rettgeri]